MSLLKLDESVTKEDDTNKLECTLKIRREAHNFDPPFNFKKN